MFLRVVRVLLRLSALLCCLPAWSQYWEEVTEFAPTITYEGRAANITFARQHDGRVVVGGAFDLMNGQPIAATRGIARLNSNGTTDTSFATTLGSTDAVEQLHVLADGDVLAIGLFNVAGISRRAIRLGPDGTPRPGYFGPTSLSSITAVDPVGRIYIPGNGGLTRYTPEGTLDAGYVTPLLQEIGAAAAFEDGSVIVKVKGPYTLPTIVRLTPSGDVDDGFQLEDVPDLLPPKIHDLIALPDGSVLVMGPGRIVESSSIFVRIDASGRSSYRYLGGPDSTPTPDREFEVAGVLHDVLEDSGASPGAPRHARFPSLHGVRTRELAVSSNGILLITEQRGAEVLLSRYERTSLGGPSVAPDPVILTPMLPSESTKLVGDSHLQGVIAGGLFPLAYQWFHDGTPVPGATEAQLSLFPLTTEHAGTYTVEVSNAYGAVTSPSRVLHVKDESRPLVISEQHVRTTATLGSNTYPIEVVADGAPVPAFEWFFNGRPYNSWTRSPTGEGVLGRILVQHLKSADAGIYSIHLTSGTNTRTIDAILGITSEEKVDGDGSVVDSDVLHPNGNIYDQMLLEGQAAVITADPDKVSRISFLDLNDDIVQVEMSGAGTVALLLDPESASGPSTPANYVQPNVHYMKGHAGIVVAGADKSTHLSVFSVGRANAVNQTLFKEDVVYDGVADIAFIAILSDDGKFGGLYAGNTSFFAVNGLTGIYAPDVAFEGSVTIGNIDAHDEARPVLMFGSTSSGVRVAGGDLDQSNQEPVRVSGLASLQFRDGTTSHGNLLPAQPNRGNLLDGDEDVSDAIVK